MTIKTYDIQAPVQLTEEERAEQTLENYTKNISADDAEQKENHPGSAESRTYDLLLRLSAEISKMKSVNVLYKVPAAAVASLAEVLHEKIKAGADCTIEFEKKEKDEVIFDYFCL